MCILCVLCAATATAVTSIASMQLKQVTKDAREEEKNSWRKRNKHVSNSKQCNSLSSTYRSASGHNTNDVWLSSTNGSMQRDCIPVRHQSNPILFTFLSAAHDDLSDKFLNEKSNEISSRKTNNRRAMPSIYNNSSRRRRKCWNLMKKDNIGNYRSTFLKTNATYRSQLACCFTKCIKQINTFLLLYSFAESK